MAETENTENIVRDIFGESDDESDNESETLAVAKTVASDDDSSNGDSDQEQHEEVQREEQEEEEEGEGEKRGQKEKDSDSSASDLDQSEEVQQEDQNKVVIPELSSDSEDEVIHNEKPDIVYDFDLMLQRKKEMNSRRRRKKNSDIINDSDEIIAELISEMRQAADEDYELNRNRRAATNKLKLLPLVENQLQKIDLREALLDSGILNAITDWLTRLPDGSLPHLQIRQKLLKILVDFNIDDIDRIKSSGVGKAVMYLFKHPKETRENKKMASHLISHWSRPIFQLDTDFHSISRDEREQRDLEHMAKSRRRPPEPIESGIQAKLSKSSEKVIKPGEKGWVPRARVPMPSMKDYVIRPKSNLDIDMSRISNKKTIGRFEKHLRNFREMKKMNKMNRAVPISIEGRKMAL